MQNTESHNIFTIDWERPDAENFYLETVAYRSDTSFDALSRPKSIQYPADINGERKMLLPAYNRAGALESVSLGTVPPSGGQGVGGGVGVAHIAYNAKGQRTLLALANGLMTRYEYEPDTFRLLRMRTEKCKRTGATFTPDGGLLQDLAYTYDLAGNITRIRDRGTGIGINGPATINRDYAYDALYRLTDATGIEHAAYTHATEPWQEIMQAHNDDLTRARLYRQQYDYDPMGNLLELRHRNLQGEAGHYTRVFQNATANNRLLSLKQGAHTYAYQYDPNGNMTRENTNRRYTWNHADQLAGFRDQPEGSASTVDACYLYGANGLRVKKIVLSGGAVLKTSTYIGNAFEYHTRGTAENNTLHLLDDTQRIALWRIGPPLNGNAAGDPAIQYQICDHLGSSSMTADETGKMIHREEFTPYGETAFGGHAQKRYRYTGMERDEESGMQYHSARYYLPWLGRWGSCDPIGLEGGANLYRYVSGNPVIYTDSTGKEADCGTISTCDDAASNQMTAADMLESKKQEFIQIMKKIDSDEDHYISVNELMSKNFSFYELEEWRDSFFLNTDAYLDVTYVLDQRLQDYINGTLTSANDIRVSLNSMAVDDDGSGPDHGDPHHLDNVDYNYRVKDSNNTTVLGAPNADEVPYIVRRGKLPDGRNIIGLIKKGDFGVIIYGGQLVVVAAMDSKTNAGHPLAEASVKAIRGLGHEPFPRPGSGVGLTGSIEVMMFPGTTKTSDADFTYTEMSIKAEYRKIQYQRLLDVFAIEASKNGIGGHPPGP